MMPVPLLIISDAPTSGTGLGRITRDLATRIATYLPDVYRVATLGYAGPYSSKLPFQQYGMTMDNWVIHNLPEVWEDFCGEQKGTIMVVWDASRTLWFTHPENCTDLNLRKFLQESTFNKWTYPAMDATGPHDKLTGLLKYILEGNDRVIAYSKWAEDILRRTLWKKPLLEGLTNLPHGLDTSVFYPRDKEEARAKFGERIGMRNQAGKWLAIPDNFLLIGIVATNQARKDFGLAFQIIAELAKDRPTAVWIHTDEFERSWHIPALFNDFAIKSHVVSIAPLTDEHMAWCYSACDFTLGIGNGEGFGYPIFESLACGVPCFHGNYGGAAEHLEYGLKVDPVAFRLEGSYNAVRAVYTPESFVSKIRSWPKENVVKLPEHLDWNNLWPRWEKWLREGVE